MLKRLMPSVLTVLVACAALSCAPDTRTDSLFGPETSDVPQLQSQDSRSAQADSAHITAAEKIELTPIVASQLSAAGYTLITEPPPPLVRSLLGWVVKTVDATLSKLLGSNGGLLSLLGHVLQVPQGAVSEPTLFSMTVIQKGYVEVELTATPKSILSSLLFWKKVEPVQFAKPVGLSLSYARATNVTDPSRLKILRLNPDGRHEIMPSTVDPVRKTVTADLDHFSRYCLVAD